MQRLVFTLALAASACVERGAPPLRHPATSETQRAPVSAPPSAPPQVSPAPVEAPSFHWVLAVDHGIRGDKAGAGGFLAPRSHGSHNGLDLLAPLGTPVLAPCSGKARAGRNPSHGKWVHLVCPLPAQLGLGRGRHASFFFAHLNDTAELGAEFGVAPAGGVVGSVGKTGNASGGAVSPHLHFEAIIHDTEANALAETHSGRDQSETAAAGELGLALQQRCLGPSGLEAHHKLIWRARRIDPFVLLVCLGAAKPTFKRPPGKLGEASYAWSTAYQATGFDVDSQALPDRASGQSAAQ
ncbi:MAG: M23 family metallopeptidase [Myxococcales bacterium]|nr:M23 family metallopeptidase [Myxococcales bacterium]